MRPRPTARDLSGAVFEIKKRNIEEKDVDHEQIEEAKKKKTNYYTFSGWEDFKDEDSRPRLLVDDAKKTLAKRNKFKHETYFVRIDADGNLYDPMGLYTSKVDQMFNIRHDRTESNFAEVTKVVFDLYLSYLTTRNNIFLTKANREL